MRGAYSWDIRNNVIAVQIGNYVKLQGGDWEDVVRLTNE